MSVNSYDCEWFTVGKWYEISRYVENNGVGIWKNHLNDVIYDVYIIDNYGTEHGFKYKNTKSTRHFGTYFYTLSDIRKFKLDKINGLRSR